MPEAGSGSPGSGEHKAAIVMDSDVTGIESNIAARIAELANGDKGTGSEVGNNVNSSGSKWERRYV